MQKGKDGKERHLRFCPICVSEDRERFGESYWHRLHQLQGMNCCNIHKCRLIDSSVIISGKDSPKLVTAEEMLPSESAIEIADNVKEIRLADYMARVFQADMDMESEVTIGASYNVVKPVGEKRYSNKTVRKHNKGGRNKQDWNNIDKQTLPKVTAAIKDLQGSRIERPKKVTVYAVARKMKVHSKYFDNLPLCKQEILKHYESQEEYWAREVVWAVQKILSEGQPLNWKHIRNLTNMRNENFQACKPYLEKYADTEMAEKIKELL